MPPKARRRRGGRRDNRNRGPKGPPQTPQLKVTVRNVHGLPTCRLMGDNLMRGLIGRANSLLEQQYKMVLEETSLMAAIEAEEAALEKRKAWEKEQEAKHGGSKEDEETDGEPKEEPEADNGKETSQEDTAKPPTAAAATTAKPERETIVQGMENLAIAADDTVIKVRVLYIVPSKQTRRRGEKPGYTSLLLMAPPIANKNPPPPPQPKVAAPDETAASAVDTKDEPKPQEVSNANGDTPVVKDQAKAETPPHVVVDYSSDIARRRLMLQRSLDALVQAAQQDEGATYQVEESPSAKTFRISNRRDRLEGTLQDSPDYKQFFSKTQQAQEERKARPKPAPGGSLLVKDGLSSSTTTSTSLQQQPVAAIVLHLQQKKQEERRKKAKKNKGNKNNNTNKVAAVENKGGGRKKRNKKKPAGG